jgi:hypothetical protein
LTENTRTLYYMDCNKIISVCVSRTVNVAELLMHFLCGSLSKNTFMSPF